MQRVSEQTLDSFQAEDLENVGFLGLVACRMSISGLHARTRGIFITIAMNQPAQCRGVQFNNFSISSLTLSHFTLALSFHLFFIISTTLSLQPPLSPQRLHHPKTSPNPPPISQRERVWHSRHAATLLESICLHHHAHQAHPIPLSFLEIQEGPLEVAEPSKEVGISVRSERGKFDVGDKKRDWWTGR